MFPVSFYNLEEIQMGFYALILRYFHFQNSSSCNLFLQSIPTTFYRCIFNKIYPDHSKKPWTTFPPSYSTNSPLRLTTGINYTSAGIVTWLGGRFIEITNNSRYVSNVWQITTTAYDIFICWWPLDGQYTRVHSLLRVCVWLTGCGAILSGERWRDTKNLMDAWARRVTTCGPSNPVAVMSPLSPATQEEEMSYKHRFNAINRRPNRELYGINV